jgi:hypothetical protein
MRSWMEGRSACNERINWIVDVGLNAASPPMSSGKHAHATMQLVSC